MTCQEKILSNDFFDIIADFTVSIREYATGEIDYCTINLESNLAMAYISRRDFPNLNLVMTRYQYVPKCYGLMETPPNNNIPNNITPNNNTPNNNTPNNNINIAANTFNLRPLIDSGIIQVNREPLSLTGRGVIIGFIDTGIRYDLDVFKNSDGTSRILGIWDQTIQTGTPPEDLPYGSEYTNEMINEALQSDNPLQIVPTTDARADIGLNIRSLAKKI